MNTRELKEALKVAARWASWQEESLDDFHAYAQMFGCQPGANVFDFVLGDALKPRGLTWDQFHRAANRKTLPDTLLGGAVQVVRPTDLRNRVGMFLVERHGYHTKSKPVSIGTVQDLICEFMESAQAKEGGKP